MVILIIILLSGVALYALLQPPASIAVSEEAVTDEPLKEVQLSSITLPEYTNLQNTHTTKTNKEE